MPKVNLDAIVPSNATGYPDPFHKEVLGRWWKRIAPAAGAIFSGGRSYPLSPGMAVVVEFKLGTRRVMDFLLSPLERHWDESLRER